MKMSTAYEGPPLTTHLYRSPEREPLPATVLFRNSGDYWTVGFDHHESMIRDGKGLHHLFNLLFHPGIEIHVLDLVAFARGQGHTDRLAVDSFPELDGPALNHEIRDPEEYPSAFGDAGPMLDNKALAAYRKRWSEACGELDAAKQSGNEQRALGLEEEIDVLRRELSRAVGLGGRRRVAADAAERARVNVTRTIKLAVQRIAEVSPALGQHLSTSVRTGCFCSYRPDRTNSILWRF